MSNLIVTGGFGGSTGDNQYSDIDWSKDSYSLVFQIADTHDINFDIITTSIDFKIEVMPILFNINTHSETFNIETHSISFTGNTCG